MKAGQYKIDSTNPVKIHKDWAGKKVTILYSKILILEKFRNYSTFLPAFYLIMWLMK